MNQLLEGSKGWYVTLATLLLFSTTTCPLSNLQLLRTKTKIFSEMNHKSTIKYLLNNLVTKKNQKMTKTLMFGIHLLLNHPLNNKKLKQVIGVLIQGVNNRLLGREPELKLIEEEVIL